MAIVLLVHTTKATWVSIQSCLVYIVRLCSMYLYAFTLILTTADWQAWFSDAVQLDLASWSGSSAWAGAALSIMALRRLSDDRKHEQYKMLEVAMFT